VDDRHAERGQIGRGVPLPPARLAEAIRAITAPVGVMQKWSRQKYAFGLSSGTGRPRLTDTPCDR
jgi:hypothetical protein